MARPQHLPVWQNPKYNALFAQQAAELDPIKRVDLLIRMKDLVVNDDAVISLIARPQVAAAKNELVAEISGYDSYLWDLRNWYMNS